MVIIPIRGQPREWARSLLKRTPTAGVQLKQGLRTTVIGMVRTVDVTDAGWIVEVPTYTGPDEPTWVRRVIPLNQVIAIVNGAWPEGPED